jgi:hypothetical protein
MTLHLTQIFFTDARTFMVAALLRTQGKIQARDIKNHL